MTQFLVLTLYGPLASWGEIGVGEVRDTNNIPTRSAILGLVAGALGIRRDSEQRQRALHDGVGVAVLVKHQGSLLQDYHTAQAPPSKFSGKWSTRRQALSMADLSTVLSWRSYRCDALYRVVIWERLDCSVALHEIQDAIRRPVFVPSLGRRSCVVSVPMMPMVVSASTVEEAVRAYEKNENVVALGYRLKKLGRRTESEQVLAADIDASLEAGAHRRVMRRDAMAAYRASRWQYLDRPEIQRSIPNER